MKKYFWLVAGALIGLYSAMTAYWNMNILVGSSDLTLTGVLIVTAEYTVIIYGLSLLEKSLNSKPKRK